MVLQYHTEEIFRIRRQIVMIFKYIIQISGMCLQQNSNQKLIMIMIIIIYKAFSLIEFQNWKPSDIFNEYFIPPNLI